MDTNSSPPLPTTVPDANPAESTNWSPPFSSAYSATPEDAISCTPPRDTTSKVALPPLMVSRPSLSTVVDTTLPPRSTSNSPPLDTTSPRLVTPEETVMVVIGQSLGVYPLAERTGGAGAR